MKNVNLTDRANDYKIVVVYRATGNSTGVEKVELRVRDGMILSDAGHDLNCYWSPPQPLDDIGTERASWLSMGLFHKRKDAVASYRALETERMETARRALELEPA